MKVKFYTALILFLSFVRFSSAQDSLTYSNTRTLTLESAVMSDSLSGSPLLYAFDSLGISQSVNFYKALMDSIDYEVSKDSTLDSFGKKVGISARVMTNNSESFLSAVSPLFFGFLLLWFLVKFVKVFLFQPELIEPENEEEK